MLTKQMEEAKHFQEYNSATLEAQERILSKRHDKHNVVKDEVVEELQKVQQVLDNRTLKYNLALREV